jgi:hypothetical protein
MEQASPGAAEAAAARRFAAGEHVALLAIVLPAIGYAAAYQFRLGELRYMGLPEELLSLGLKDVVDGGIVVVVAAALIVAVLNFFATVVADASVSEVERSLVQFSVAVGIMALLFVFSGQMAGAGWVGFGIAAGLVALIQFVPPLLVQKDLIGYEAKLRAYRRRERSGSHSVIGRLLGSQRELVLVVSLAYVVLFVASPVGAFSARSRTLYAVVPTNPERIVVSEYEGSLVTLEFNRQLRTASSPVMVSRPEYLRAGLLVEHVGPVQFRAAQ